MKYVLRDYQQASADACLEFLDMPSSQNGLVVVPTGGGKSLIIAETVTKSKRAAIIFQPSKEILVQNYEKLLDYGYSPSIYSASMGQREVGTMTLATIGSVYKKPELFSHCSLAIVDECHLVNAKGEDTMFMNFLGVHPAMRVIGLSATPYRLNHDAFGGCMMKFLTRTKPRVFDRVLHIVQNGDLFRAGYLAKLEYKEVQTGFRADRLRLNSTGADYTEESLHEHFRELHFSDQIVRCVKRLDELNRGQSIIFTRFVEEAEYVAKRVAGCAMVSAKTDPDLRYAILHDFKAGKIRHVANVGVLAVGFDFPALANVILARPTRSLALYYQMVGRCVRPHPSKQAAFIIDMVGLSKKFGHVEDLVIQADRNDLWYVTNGQRQLTNVYFDQEKAA